MFGRSFIRHEILNETDKMSVYEDILKYIQLLEKKHYL